MEITHELMVYLAKTAGLFYFIALSIAVLVYTFWPSNKERFERAAKSVLDDEQL